MALPIIGFIILLALSVFLYVFGFSRNNLNAGFAFMTLASVLLIVSSLFVMGAGLELNQVSSIEQVGTVTSVSYASVDYSLDEWNWLRVVVDIILYGGFVGIVFGLVYSIKQSQSRQVEDWI